MLLTRLNRMVVLLPLSYSCQLFNDIIYVYHCSFVQCVCKQLHSELQGLRHKPWRKVWAHHATAHGVDSAYSAVVVT